MNILERLYCVRRPILLSMAKVNYSPVIKLIDGPADGQTEDPDELNGKDIVNLYYDVGHDGVIFDLKKFLESNLTKSPRLHHYQLKVKGRKNNGFVWIYTYAGFVRDKT